MKNIPLPTERLLSRDFIAKRLAVDLQPDWVVNLGIGMPTLTTKYVKTEQDIVFHSENGIIGMGPQPKARTMTFAMRERIFAHSFPVQHWCTMRILSLLPAVGDLTVRYLELFRLQQMET